MKGKVYHMDNVMVIVILSVICILAVIGCIKKKSHGCCGSDDLKLKVRDKNPANYPYTAEVTVEGMTCANCKLRVENAFHETGAMWAKADLKTGKVLVRMKEDATDEKLENLVKRAGYTAAEIIRK